MLSPINQAVERGATRLAVQDASKFKEGDRVRIYVNESPEAAERPKSGGSQADAERGVLGKRESANESPEAA